MYRKSTFTIIATNAEARILVDCTTNIAWKRESAQGWIELSRIYRRYGGNILHPSKVITVNAHVSGRAQSLARNYLGWLNHSVREK